MTMEVTAKRSNSHRYPSKRNPRPSTEGYNDYIRRNRQEYRQKVLEHYGGCPPKCDCCGETEIMFLTIDHMNGKDSRIDSGVNLYMRLKRDNYPSGYRVLCYNCNCSIGHYGFCPHNGGYC